MGNFNKGTKYCILISPMMHMTLCKTKEEYKDCILFYRLGDFYNVSRMQEVVSRVELTLTGKDCGMSGHCTYVRNTFHAARGLFDAISKGYEVANTTQTNGRSKQTKESCAQRSRPW